MLSLLNDFTVYLHIPFCKYKCPYCDFNTYAVNYVPEEDYLKALEIEFNLVKERWLGKNLISIYWGGGTPGLISAKGIKHINDLILSDFQHSSEIEVTVEANPKELDLDQLKEFKEVGVTRLSLGVQSLNNKTLARLGRKHQREDVMELVKNLQSIDFKNYSLDLIFAVPDQLTAELEKDLEDYLILEPPHLSCYELTIEKATPFYQSYLNGVIKPQNDSRKLEMYQLVKTRLEESGYQHYEVSNYAKDNRHSIHNSHYWQNGSYLGLGAGAHSCFREARSAIRSSNLANYKLYQQKLNEGQAVVSWQEKLVAKDVAFETLLLGLRTQKGVSIAEINPLLAEDESARLLKLLLEFESDEFLKLTEENISLTSKGLEVCDSVTEKISSCL